MKKRFVWFIQISDEFGNVYDQVAVCYGKLADFIKESGNALIQRSVREIGNPSNDEDALIILRDCDFWYEKMDLYE